MIGNGGDAADLSGRGALAEAIQRYLNQGYRLEKSKKAREHAVAHFSKHIIIDEIIKMYEKILIHPKDTNE